MEGSVLPQVSRRDFLKFCGALAVVIGAGEAAGPKVASALETLAKRPSIVWIGMQSCSGCSVSLLQSRTPSVANLILREVSLDYHEVVMAAAGHQAEKTLQEAFERGDYYLVVEGSIPTKMPEALMSGGRPATQIVKEAYSKAKGTIAIGSCASFGNIQASNPNPTGAKGVAQFLKEDGGVANPVVINITRCPGNAEDMLSTLAYILFYSKLPELDAVGRPKFLYGQTIHDNCERRGHFENGEFVEVFGDEGSLKRWCLYKVGCKGPQTYAPCGTNKWNGHQTWCINSGPCTGCSEPGFWDNMHPFRGVSAAATPPIMGGIAASTIGTVLGGATAAGLAAHLVGQVATGRFGHGGPPEEEEEKKSPKGGKS